MTYSETWFGKQPMAIHGSRPWDGRHYWMHKMVEVMTGRMLPMNQKNPDGSIDVLGAEVEHLHPGLVMGGYGREGLQRSLCEFAEQVAAAGATIVRQTKNTLVARYQRETMKIEISTSRKAKIL